MALDPEALAAKLGVAPDTIAFEGQRNLDDLTAQVGEIVAQGARAVGRRLPAHAVVDALFAIGDVQWENVNSQDRARAAVVLSELLDRVIGNPNVVG